MYTGAGTIMPISASGSMYARSSAGLYKRAAGPQDSPAKRFRKRNYPAPFCSMVKAESAESVYSAS